MAQANDELRAAIERAETRASINSHYGILVSTLREIIAVLGERPVEAAKALVAHYRAEEEVLREHDDFSAESWICACDKANDALAAVRAVLPERSEPADAPTVTETPKGTVSGQCPCCGKWIR